jgi:hypothetical protein
VDCETDGVHRDRRAYEVAIIRREPNGTTETLHAFISDVDLTSANLNSLQVGGFHNRHPAYANRRKPGSPLPPLPEGTVYRSERWLAQDIEWFTRDAHLVGCVPNFDAEVFGDMLVRYQLAPAWHYHLIDVEALVVGYLRGRAAENPGGGISGAVTLPWSSDDLSRACGIEPPTEEERHTALGDALWAMRLYDFIISGTKGTGQ